ncbi:nitrate reductase subunit alpha [Burkholderia pseudomallei]|nr:nitrate reductase subunit alpha [Burkholderia pseudomallei]
MSLKPTHMIGGYAQLSYGFNYYGTVGSNRDEFLIVRKMKRIDWLDGENESARAPNVSTSGADDERHAGAGETR